MERRQHAPLPINPVGDLLRAWRNRRAMSQADLAFEAGISIKHLSYVETGKAAGSRDILLQLASALDLSLRDRNALLEAGGFARQYGERDLSAPEVADAKRAIDLLLRRHEPFPAIVTDRQWNVKQANRAATRLMTMLLGSERMTRPLNHMRMFLAPDELRPFVVDWPEVAAALMARARHEAMAAPLDLALQSTWRELLKLPDVAVPQLNESEASVVRGAPEEGRSQHRADRRGADAGDAAGRHAAGIARGNVHAGGCRLRGCSHRVGGVAVSSPFRSGFPADVSIPRWPCRRNSRR